APAPLPRQLRAWLRPCPTAGRAGGCWAVHRRARAPVSRRLHPATTAICTGLHPVPAGGARCPDQPSRAAPPPPLRRGPVDGRAAQPYRRVGRVGGCLHIVWRRRMTGCCGACAAAAPSIPITCWRHGWSELQGSVHSRPETAVSWQTTGTAVPGRPDRSRRRLPSPQAGSPRSRRPYRRYTLGGTAGEPEPRRLRMSAQRSLVHRWLPDDTEESIVGADWHQDAISSLRNGLRDVARARSWPWHVGDQLTLVAWHPDGTIWRPKPDLMVHPHAGPTPR